MPSNDVVRVVFAFLQNVYDKDELSTLPFFRGHVFVTQVPGDPTALRDPAQEATMLAGIATPIQTVLRATTLMVSGHTAPMWHPRDVDALAPVTVAKDVSDPDGEPVVPFVLVRTAMPLLAMDAPHAKAWGQDFATSLAQGLNAPVLRFQDAARTSVRPGRVSAQDLTAIAQAMSGEARQLSVPAATLFEALDTVFDAPALFMQRETLALQALAGETPVAPQRVVGRGGRPR